MSGEIVYMESAIHGTCANGSFYLESSMPSRNAFPIAVRLFRSSARSISPASSRMRHAIYAAGSEVVSRPIATYAGVFPRNSIDTLTDARATNAATIAVVMIAPVLYPMSAIISPNQSFHIREAPIIADICECPSTGVLSNRSDLPGRQKSPRSPCRVGGERDGKA